MKALRENIYLDIDGVILTRGVLPAQHLDKFLKYILGNYSVFWLTSRYHGETKKIIGYLSQFLTPEIISLLGQIKPTSFDLDKTEAIDFARAISPPLNIDLTYYINAGNKYGQLIV